MTAQVTGPIDGWRAEKDFFSRWALYPPEPELLRMIEDTGARSFIDLGCGGAPYLGHFHRKGWKVFGCDVSPMAVDIQRRVLPAHLVQEMDIFRVRPPHAFEVGLLRGVLYYSPTPEKLRFLDAIAPALVSDVLILEEFVIDRSCETRDFRGIPQYWEDWRALVRELKHWDGTVRPKQDPFFLARFIQVKKPDYKPADDLVLSQWIVLKRRKEHMP